LAAGIHVVKTGCGLPIIKHTDDLYKLVIKPDALTDAVGSVEQPIVQFAANHSDRRMILIVAAIPGLAIK
jgi:hypothetical protein